MTFKDMASIIGTNYHGSAPAKSVGKPSTKDENGPQGITAMLTGGDAGICNDEAKWTAKLMNYKLMNYEKDPQVVTAMRESSKRILYTVANSNALNKYAAGSAAKVTEIDVPDPWESWLKYAQYGTASTAVLFLAISILSSVNAKKKAAPKVA